MRRIFSLLLALLFLAGCAAQTAVPAQPTQLQAAAATQANPADPSAGNAGLIQLLTAGTQPPPAPSFTPTPSRPAVPLSDVLEAFPLYPGVSWTYEETVYRQQSDPDQVVTAIYKINRRVVDVQETGPVYIAHMRTERSLLHADDQYTDAPGGFYVVDSWYVILDGQIFSTTELPNPDHPRLERMTLELRLPIQEGDRWCPNPVKEGAEATPEPGQLPCEFGGKRTVHTIGTLQTKVQPYAGCYQLVDFYNDGSFTHTFCPGVGFVGEHFDHQGTRFGSQQELSAFTPNTQSVKTNPPANLADSARAAQDWQRFALGRYGFSFLYPKSMQVKALDAHHQQVIYAQKGAALTIGYRFKSEAGRLAPNLPDVAALPTWGTFSFLGDWLPLKEIPAENGLGKAYFYDGGGELARGNLVFTLRLQSIDPKKTLEDLTSDEVHSFEFIVGSFQLDPPKITQRLGSKVNLAQLGLEKTESIEVGVFNPQIASSRYLYQHLLNDPQRIAQIIQALDQPQPIQSGTGCVEAYELNFHLSDGRQVTFGYQCGSYSGLLTRGQSSDGSLALGGDVPVPTRFTQLLISEISKAEQLRENNAPPMWQARIDPRSQKTGPFTLEEYIVLDTGRWQPYSLEFRAILPDWVFQKRADLRKPELMPWPIQPVQVGGQSISVIESWDATHPQNYAVVDQGSDEIFRIPIRQPAGVSAVRGLWAWGDHWVLEVEGHIIIDGKELNDQLGAQETFDWQMVDGKPFAFFIKDGQINAWYDQKVYPLGYDQVVHNTCCEAGAFDVGHNQKMIWFYAKKDGLWRYVEMGLF